MSPATAFCHLHPSFAACITITTVPITPNVFPLDCPASPLSNGSALVSIGPRVAPQTTKAHTPPPRNPPSEFSGTAPWTPCKSRPHTTLIVHAPPMQQGTPPCTLGHPPVFSAPPRLRTSTAGISATAGPFASRRPPFEPPRSPLSNGKIPRPIPIRALPLRLASYLFVNGTELRSISFDGFDYIQETGLV